MYVSIFDGITPKKCRDFVAQQILARAPETIYFPRAERFTIPEILCAKQASRKDMLCSDIGIFPSIIGYLADPEHELSELNITLPSEAPLPESDDPLEIAANILLWVRYQKIPPASLHDGNIRKEYRVNWKHYRSALQTDLTALIASLHGIHYEMLDTTVAIGRAMDDENGLLFISLPEHQGIYANLLRYSDITWAAPEGKEIGPENHAEFFKNMAGAKCATLAYVRVELSTLETPGGEESLETVPEGWTAAFAFGKGSGRMDYVLSNREMNVGYSPQKTIEPTIKKFPVYNDEDITEDSLIQFIPVDRHTCLYYRDLFVHKLGASDCETHFLMLIDGRVVTALGMTNTDLRRFTSEYLFEMFGITITSKKYLRLGKLFMLALTCTDLKKVVMTMPGITQYGVAEPKGVRTSSITTFAEGKTDRSVMRLVNREKLPDGRFKVMYQADFRDETFSDVLRIWLKRWGKRSRNNEHGSIANTAKPAAASA